MKPSSSWQQQTLSHWPMINRLAGRRFPHGALAEEAALFVMDKLAENDWQRMQAFGGQSSLATYVAAVALRLLEDFARLRFGRIRAPLWVRRLGGIWEDLFGLLCLERFSPAEAVEILTTRQACTRAVAEKTAYQLLGEVPNCGGYRGEETEISDELSAGEEHEGGSQPEQKLEHKEREQCLQALASIVFGEGDSAPNTPMLGRMLHAKISLEPRERLLLKLCFRDGIAVSEAGRMLGWNRHQVHGRLRRLLQRLRRDFAAAGVDQELQLLNS
ncbi:MAG: sigma factor-like helix-turn-helix DNA-binding protein [Desulfobulbus sp.]